MVDLKDYLKNPLFDYVDFDDKPIKVNTSEIGEHPIHFHDCLEIVYVLSGTIALKISYKNFVINEGEFAIINSYDLHSIKSITDFATIAYMHFAENICIQNNNLVAWKVNDLKSQQEIYKAINENVVSIIRNACIDNKDIRCAVRYAKNIGTIIKNNLMMAMYPYIGEKSSYNEKEFGIQRMEKIFHYMYQRIDERITLEETADAFNVSKYYLSHFIKKGMGLSFKDMVNLTRVDRSELFVLNKFVPISEIVYMVGFSSMQYFNKCFMEYFNNTPAKHRELYINDTIANKAFSEKAIKIKERDISGQSVHQNRFGNISIKLEKYLYEATIIYKDGISVIGDTWEISKKDNKELHFDGDELIIVINRKK